MGKLARSFMLIIQQSLTALCDRKITERKHKRSADQ
jgi:hypothetical protein